MLSIGECAMEEKNKETIDDLHKKRRLLDEEEEYLLDMKKQGLREFEEEDYELSIRNRKLEDIMYSCPIEDTKLYELLSESQNAMKKVKDFALNRIENLEYNLQKRHNENCEKREEISQKIKKLNEEKE